MADTVNDRDVRLVNTFPRSGAEGAGVILTATSQTVKTVNGVLSPETIEFEAMQFAQGALTWAVDGAALTGTGLKRSMTTSTMTKDTVTVTVTVTPVGAPARSHTATINRLANGANGDPGARGAGMYYAAGNAWTDAAAETATPGATVVGDLVTISNGTFYLSKRWNGSIWEAPGTVLDGSLIVTESISASKIDASGLSIKDVNGNVILSAGATPVRMPVAYAPTGTVNADLLPAIADAKNTTFSALYHWEFRNSADGWTGLSYTQTLGADSITIDSTGTDPIFGSPTNLTIAGSSYDKVRARVRRKAGDGWDGAIYWTSTDGGTEGGLGGKGMANPGLVIDQWTTLEWDLSDKVNWTSKTINKIRLDFGTKDADIFEIDWVAVGKYGVPVSDSAFSAVQAELIAIGSDSTLSKGEKSDVIQRWNTCDLEKASLVAQAHPTTGLNVSTTAYLAAHQAVSDYLGTLSPLWSDVTKDSPIDATIWKDRWNTYYDQKQKLINALAAKAATLASWGGVTGAGKPEDGATFTSASRGSALNDDPNFENANAWTFSPNISIATTGGLAGGSGVKFASCITGVDQWARGKRTFAIDAKKVYNLTALLWVAGGNNRDMYIYVNFYDYAGTQLVALNDSGQSWGGTMSGYTFGGLPAIDVWTRYGGLFGPGTGRNIPAGARTAQIGVWFQYAGGGSSQVNQGAMDLRIEEATLVANALSQLTAIASDDVLSRGEKQAVEKEWDAIYNERGGIWAQSTALLVNNDDYTAKFNTLQNYLANIPGWGNRTVDSAINGTTFRDNFTNYYVAKQALLNEVAAKAATMANWGGVTGTGKPADNASSDIVLIGRGVTVTGNTLTKTQATANWDADAYSSYGYVGGAYASATVTSLTARIMFALNPDPLADTSYVSLDCAIYFDNNGSPVATIYENSAPILGLGAYAIGDVFTITYDGTNVRYLKNGTVLRTVAKNYTAALYFDSSFYTQGGSLKNVRFGPLSSNRWEDVGGTGKPENNATNGATLGTNVSGSINDSNAAGLVTISNLRIINSKIGNFSTAGTGGKMDLNDNGIKVFDGGNALMIRIGNTSA